MKITLLASIILSVMVSGISLIIPNQFGQSRLKNPSEFQPVSSSKNLGACATLIYGESCGIPGQNVYVANVLKDKAVTATVRTHWKQGAKEGDYDKVYTIPAGSKESLGCDRRTEPLTSYSYSLVGCVVN